jgi:hypothetical protein
VAATGVKGFYAFLLDDYLRKVQRYTFQRGFVESYVLNTNSSDWMKGRNTQQASLEICEKKEYITRNVKYPEYESLYPLGNAFVGNNILLNLKHTDFHGILK